MYANWGGDDFMDLKEIKVNPSYENTLQMKAFVGMLNSTSQSYKFYWLEAILNLLLTKDVMSFREIIDEMLWQAWYTVTQYHLHLGPTIEGKCENYIEHAIHVLEEEPNLPSSISRDDFTELLDRHRKEIRPDVYGLIKNVPYRLLSSFMDEVSGDASIWDNKERLIKYISALNDKVTLPYIIENGPGAEKKVLINPVWKQVFMDNLSLIKSWIQMKKVEYLQQRNPEVPGIIYKLEEHKEVRDLKNVRALWLSYEAFTGKKLLDTYNGKEIEVLSIDHFIPWSYVANDELWNLVPMDKNNNSSKGNRLPNWEIFFPKLSKVQFELYKAAGSNSAVQKCFEACRRNNLNTRWAEVSLYGKPNTEEEFQRIFAHNARPIYDSAYYLGYKVWDYTGVSEEKE